VILAKVNAHTAKSIDKCKKSDSTLQVNLPWKFSFLIVDGARIPKRVFRFSSSYAFAVKIIKFREMREMQMLKIRRMPTYRIPMLCNKSKAIVGFAFSGLTCAQLCAKRRDFIFLFLQQCGERLVLVLQELNFALIDRKV